MKKLLVICGPTATGKTSLAMLLAGKINAELVSADSRQVYKNMDIGTGKNLPPKSKFRRASSKLGGYYKTDGLKIWGYDLISPGEEFSVAQYIEIARRIIKDIHRRKKLPILVGGTGLYIKGIVEGIPTAKIPQNRNIRKNLNKKTVEELFESLAFLDPIRAGSLNRSDKKNPRRLTRAIEVAIWKLKNIGLKLKDQKQNYEVLFIGLTASRDILYQRVEKGFCRELRE